MPSWEEGLTRAAEAIDAAARRTPGQAVIYIDAQGNMRRTVPIINQVPD